MRLPKDREAERSMVYLLDTVGEFVEQTRERMKQRPSVRKLFAYEQEVLTAFAQAA